MTYTAHFIDGSCAGNIGKVVCVGRNYLEHIHELNNSVPDKPLLFMKPATSVVHLEEPISIPAQGGECHHELEIAVLIGQSIKNADANAAQEAIRGYGVALDLTLRELQKQLKSKGHPWEIAKAFDGSCPLSPFIPAQEISDPKDIHFHLVVNDETRQEGNSKMMMVGIIDLLCYISKHFTLNPGDVVLTGTPKGVSPLSTGDKLTLYFQNEYQFSTTVK